MKLKITNSTVSYLLQQYYYLQTVLISVFTVFGAFAHSRNAPLCFVLFVSGPAHILCLTVAGG